MAGRWLSLPQTGSLRYLRRPQLRALETYWYLRLAENTPHKVGRTIAVKIIDMLGEEVLSTHQA